MPEKVLTPIGDQVSSLTQDGSTDVILAFMSTKKRFPWLTLFVGAMLGFFMRPFAAAASRNAPPPNNRQAKMNRKQRQKMMARHAVHAGNLAEHNGVNT